MSMGRLFGLLVEGICRWDLRGKGDRKKGGGRVCTVARDENLIGGFRSIYHAIREQIAVNKGTRRFRLCLKQVICERTWTFSLGPTDKPTQAIELPNDFMYAVDVTDPNLQLCFNMIPGHLPGVITPVGLTIIMSRHSSTTALIPVELMQVASVRRTTSHRARGQWERLLIMPATSV